MLDAQRQPLFSIEESFRIKALMKLHRVTGRDIARKLGVSFTWVSLVINGHKDSPRVRKAIARAVGMKFELLWPDNPRKKAA